MNDTVYYQQKINAILVEYPDCKSRIDMLEKRQISQSDSEKLVDLFALALSYFMDSRIEDALEQLVVLLNLALLSKQFIFLVFTYNLIGAIYDYTGAVCHSLQAYLTALEVAKYNQFELLQEMVNNNLGELFLKVNNSEAACYYYAKSCVDYIDNDDITTFSKRRLMYMGNYIRGLVAVNRLADAKYVLSRMKHGSQATNFPYYCRFAILYYDKVDDQAALIEAFEEGVVKYNLPTDNLLLVDLMVDYGTILLRRKLPLSNAFVWLEKAQKIAVEQGLYNKLIPLLEIIAEAHLELGNDEKALESYDSYVELCDNSGKYKKNIMLTSSHYRLDLSLKDYELMLIHDSELVNLTLENKLKIIEHRIELIKNIGLEMTNMTDIKKMATSFYSYLKYLMPIDVCFIVVQDDCNRLADVCLCLADNRIIEVAEMPFAIHDSLVRQCLAERKTMYISHASEKLGVDNNYVKGHRLEEVGWVESAVFKPLFFDNRPIGVFSVQSYNIDQYDEDDLKMIDEMATFISIAIRSANINKKIEVETNNRIALQLELALQNKDPDKLFNNNG